MADKLTKRRPGAACVCAGGAHLVLESDAEHRFASILVPQRDRTRPLERYIGLRRWEQPGGSG